MVSERQKAILTKNGYTAEQIARMDYKQISEVIGEILAKNRPKELAVPAAAATPYEQAQDDKLRSMKVSYAKDLAIAMIHECALLKVDFRDIAVMKAITDNSIGMVNAMWARL